MLEYRLKTLYDYVDFFIIVESEEKKWSVEDALAQRGGLTSFSRRIFPCYTDINDVHSLKWYVFYRND